MKKLIVLAMITTLAVVGGVSAPVQAASANKIFRQINSSSYRVNTGVIDISGREALSDILNGLCENPGSANVIVFPNDCLPGNGANPETPDVESPENGTDTETPDTESPENGTDSEIPDTDVPGTGTDSEKPGNGDSGTTDSEENLTFAEQVVALVNEERAKAGLSALTLDENIASAALIRSKEIETSFSHTRPDGRGFGTVLTDNGITYRGAGENIAWGQKTPEAVMTAWMNSAGHRANILDPNFKKIGVGHRQSSSGTHYWTQLFTY